MRDSTNTPQNIKALISEIGERMTLFKLYSIIHDNNDLEIFKNYSEQGYDIGIRNIQQNNKVKIEVKTRQHLVINKADKRKKTCHFTLTENEWTYSDFLIGYWIDYNDFFIVPKSALTKTKSKNKDVYKLVFTRMKKPKGELIYSKHVMPYLNEWSTLLKFLAT